ncbi:MAG: hypothetical protein IT374_00795 [Polyangiaceae bacterium]|nr:hypothetical protein [Polyangiaceae bacterium]
MSQRDVPAAHGEPDPGTLSALANAVRGISSPFACGGSVLVRKPPDIRVRGGHLFSVTPAKNGHDQERLNERLHACCAPAKFGAGRATRYDRSVREAVQLDAAGGAFDVTFNPAKAGILDEVRRALAPSDEGSITAELHALNLYARDGHFVPHKDTPRGGGMMGSLVVCLPSHFYGGALVAMHHGADVVFDWGREIQADPDPRRIRWAAFFGDVDHTIERVDWGSRVTLTYVLRRGPGAVAEVQQGDEPARLKGELAKALASKTFLPKGGTLAFPCFHMYSQDARWQKRVSPITARNASTLKGRDLAIARAALSLGLDVTLHPYLVESCADEAWELKRFPTDAELAHFDHRMSPDIMEEVLPLAANRGASPVWVVPPPEFNRTPHRYRQDADGISPIQPGLPALQLVAGCEYSATGYFGNEGGDTDFYVYAALHVEVPGWTARNAMTRSAKAGRSRG